MSQQGWWGLVVCLVLAVESMAAMLEALLVAAQGRGTRAKVAVVKVAMEAVLWEAEGGKAVRVMAAAMAVATAAAPEAAEVLKAAKLRTPRRRRKRHR